MAIVGAYILPHGALVLDPKDSESTHLQAAMKEVGREIKDLNPDFILLSTPHGIANTYDFCFYLGDSAEGSAEWEDEYTEYKLKLKMNSQFTEEMINHLAVNNSVSGIMSFGGASPMQLRWGEVIPLWYLTDNNRKLPSVTILSQPTRRYTEASQMATELRRLGKNIYRYLEKIERRVVVIISGDLAHTHQEDGPYGYSDNAEKFDQIFVKWAEGDPDAFYSMISLTNTALSCGFTGFVMLQGMLDEWGEVNREVLSISHPTYYGMAVVKFQV